jgi:lipid-A-disaccharide synthase
MARSLKVALLAGEASGDILGAGLMRELKTQHPNIEFAGIGGEKMVAEGLESRVPMERLSVMGITEVLGRLSELLRIRKEFYRWCLEWKPDVFIGIDAPDFNLGLEANLKRSGIPTVHYVSPSVWAWRKGRIKKIRKAVSHMLTLLPFEAEFYRTEGIPVTHVGHTLADQLPLESDNSSVREKFGLKREATVVTMMPGSRGSEVNKLCSLFLDSIAQAQVKTGPLEVLIPAANDHRKIQILEILKEYKSSLTVRVLDKQADEAIAASDVVLVASGTATLQTMLWKKPMVVAYRLSAFTFWYISKLATTKWVSLPNILEQRDWVPERLQDDATVEQLSADIVKALTDESYRKDFAHLATLWHKKLALGADKQAAKAVLSLVT